MCCPGACAKGLRPRGAAHRGVPPRPRPRARPARRGGHVPRRAGAAHAHPLLLVAQPLRRLSRGTPQPRQARLRAVPPDPLVVGRCPRRDPGRRPGEDPPGQDPLPLRPPRGAGGPARPRRDSARRGGRARAGGRPDNRPPGRRRTLDHRRPQARARARPPRLPAGAPRPRTPRWRGLPARHGRRRRRREPPPGGAAGTSSSTPRAT